MDYDEPHNDPPLSSDEHRLLHRLNTYRAALEDIANAAGPINEALFMRERAKAALREQP